MRSGKDTGRAAGGTQGGGVRIAADRDTFQVFTTKKYRAAKTATLYHKFSV